MDHQLINMHVLVTNNHVSLVVLVGSFIVMTDMLDQGAIFAGRNFIRLIGRIN